MDVEVDAKVDADAQERGPGRWRSVLAWSTGAALVALHLAPWRPPAELWFDWLPAELVWRLGWTLLAWLWLLWFCGRVWRAEPRVRREEPRA